MVPNRWAFWGRIFFVFFICLPAATWGLPFDDRQIQHIEREILTTLREIVSQNVEETPIQLSLQGKRIRDLVVDDGELTIAGFSPELRRRLLEKGTTVSELSQTVSIQGHAFVSTGNIQSLVQKLIAQQPAGKVFWKSVAVTLKDGLIQVHGEANLLELLSQIMSVPAFLSFGLEKAQFSAEGTAVLKAGKIVIELHQASLNGQPFPSDFQKQVLEALNPVWDPQVFSWSSNLEALEIRSSGIFLSGWFFKN